MRKPFSATWPMRLLVPAALSLAMAGCAGGGNSQGTFGAPATSVEPGEGTKIADHPVAGVGGPSAPPQTLIVGTGPDAVEYSCPMVDVRSGASTWQVQAPGGGLKYQASIATLARECAISGTTMTMKVGIEGRLLLGEKGAPGGVSVPVRVAVVQEGPEPKTIASKFFTVPLNVPPGETQLMFSVVEDSLSFPVTNPGDVERYVVYVGFDPKGTADTPARTRPATTRPKPAVAASEATAPKPAASKPAASKPAASKPESSSAAASSSAPASDSGASGAAAGGSGFAPPPTAGGGFSGGSFGPPPGTFAPPPAQ